jgi:hypothetical protein
MHHVAVDPQFAQGQLVMLVMAGERDVVLPVAMHADQHREIDIGHEVGETQQYVVVAGIELSECPRVAERVALFEERELEIGRQRGRQARDP